jgi:hypothetical protein
MMGVRTPSSWLIYLNFMMMHGLANFKFKVILSSLAVEANVIVAELQSKSWGYQFSSRKSKNKQRTALSARL